MSEDWDRQSNRAQEDEYDLFPGTSEEGPHFRIRDMFTSHHSDSGYDHGVSVDVTHYIQDKSLRRRIVLLSLSNSKLGIRMLLVRAVFLLIASLLYVAETVYFDYFIEESVCVCGRCEYGGRAGLTLNTTNMTLLETMAQEARALVLLSEGKPYPLWALQLVMSTIVLINALAVLYATSGVTLQAILRTLSPAIGITLILPLLFLLTVFYPDVLKDLFIPSFLYCWPALQLFSTAILQALQRNSQTRPSNFRLKVVTLLSVFTCFLFSWMCVLHHFFRIEPQRHTLFETGYFLMVTMSTVGYGDIAPKHWTTRVLVTFFIVTAIIYLIPQLHQAYEAFSLQQQLHNTLSFKDRGRRHILICSQALKPLVLRDFLTEFYSDPANYDVHCVVMVEEELSSITQMYLRHPIWAKRITVLIGTPLRNSDLYRARARMALACFIHTPRDKGDGTEADQHSIMCAWAIKDFAPKLRLYVQILHPENRLHLGLADTVVCEGELRSALLAANSVCPGVSTLVALLLHTFKPEQRPLSSEEYQLYTKCAPCEIYDSRLGDSKYFHHFQGKNFLYTAVVAFRKYHVTLLGVQSQSSGKLLINPSLEYIMHQDDICYYIGFTHEEYSKVGGATSIGHALQGICAKLAIYSMISVGVDPYTLNERAGDAYGSSSSLADEVSLNEGPKVSFFISGPGGSETSLDTEHQLATCETRRGLHLFKYLSNLEPAANPVVKVNLMNVASDNTMHHSGESSSVSSRDYHMTGDLPSVTMEGHIEPSRIIQKQISEPAILSRRFSHDHHRPQNINLFRRFSHDHRPYDGLMFKAPLPMIRERTLSESSHHSMKRCYSDSSVAADKVLYSSKLELVGSTSQLHHDQRAPPSNLPRFHFPRPSLGSLRNTSAPRASITSLDVVELELADIQEEAELEELEDGLCSEASSEGRSPSPDSHVMDERTRYWKGHITNTPYLGFESQKCHLLYEKRCLDDLKLISAEPESGLSIVYSPRVSDDLYHFIFPLRAANLPSSSLKPLVVMINSQLPVEFLDTVAWLPLVFCLAGDISKINDWLKAGITQADTVVILRDPVTPNHADNDEHFADSAHIMAVHKLTRLFPRIRIVTELHYRYNIRFMRFTECDYHYMGNYTALMRKGDHLTYLFVPQFAGGRVFCPSMLDTLLYQAHEKPYIVELIRQLLGCKSEEDSGYLWQIPLTSDLLALETYERVFQRLVSQHRYIPLGIHRTIPEGHCVDLKCEGLSEKNPTFMGADRVASFLNARLESLGLSGLTNKEGKEHILSQSFVLPNPPPKTKLKPEDVILVIHPAHHSHPHDQHPPPQPSVTSPRSRTASQSSPSCSTPSQIRSTPSRARSSPLKFPSVQVSTSTPPQVRPKSAEYLHITVPIEHHDYDSVFSDESLV